MSAAASVVTVCGATDIGLHRENNEDAFVVSQLHAGSSLVPERPVDLPLDPEGVLLMVCDGIGGAAAGEVAARLACQSVVRGLSEGRAAPPSPARPALFSALQQANRAIFGESHRRKGKRGMGTTCTAAVMTHDRVLIGQVGDSRAYLFRGDKLQPLTRDQSLAAALLDAGVLAPADLKEYPHTNVVLQALGVLPDVAPVMSEVGLQVGDTILVCSDGLHGPVAEERIAAVLRGPKDLADNARTLIREALEAGGPDNVTVLLARAG